MRSRQFDIQSRLPGCLNVEFKTDFMSREHVALRGFLSIALDLEVGVPQGDLLVPIPFFLFINDFSVSFENFFTIM